jgi:hypothetical protein
VNQLPFKDRMDLVANDGTLIEADMPVSVWPATRSGPGTSGETFDHTGQAPLAKFSLLSAANRRLVSDDGQRYAIVAATPMPFVPHVALELRRVRSAGVG